MRIDPVTRIDHTPPKTTPKDSAVHRQEPRREADVLSKQAEKPPVEWSQDDLLAAVEQANQALKHSNRHFDVTVHEATQRIMVRVINSETEELVREVPPEKILNLIASLRDLAGVVVDERR